MKVNYDLYETLIEIIYTKTLKRLIDQMFIQTVDLIFCIFFFITTCDLI
jgi:hypothetical protein